ncbi:MAG: hypothetical protein MUF21_05290 [Gemmatimonadaceae bacterium]|nr:hypothetical protein [Gemmatimonadaceae bacterium]
MRPPDALLDRLYHRLVRALRADGTGDVARPFTVAELTAALVPYRTYRNELGTETLQDYEHAVLLLLGGEGARLTCDGATIALVQRELRSPDPDTSLVRRIASAEARVSSVDEALAVAQSPTPDGARVVSERTPATITHATSTDTLRPRLEFTMHGTSAMAGAQASAVATPPTSGAIPSGVVIPSPTGLLAVPATGAASRTVAHAGVAAPRTEPVARPSADDLRSAIERLRTIQRDGVATPPDGTAVAARPAPVATSTVSAPSPAVAPSAAAPAPIAPPAIAAAAPAAASEAPGAGEPIDFRGMRHAPVDIGGVMLLFGLLARDLGVRRRSTSSSAGATRGPTAPRACSSSSCAAWCSTSGAVHDPTESDARRGARRPVPVLRQGAAGGTGGDLLPALRPERDGAPLPGLLERGGARLALLRDVRARGGRTDGGRALIARDATCGMASCEASIARCWRMRRSA